MKVTFKNGKAGWIYIYIETDTAGLKIYASDVFNPFENLFTWLGLIQSSAPEAHLIIDEEGLGVELSVQQIDSEQSEFITERWFSNKLPTILLQQSISYQDIFNSFYSAILNFIKDIPHKSDSRQRRFYKSICRIQWDKLIQNELPKEYWLQRIKLLECGHRVGQSLAPKREILGLDDFPTEIGRLIKLWKGYQKISNYCGDEYAHITSELARNYANLAQDILLGDIDDNWHDQKIGDVISKLEERYEELRSLRWDKHLGIREDKIVNCLKVGQILCGTIRSIKSYGVCINVVNLPVLLHRREISKQSVDHPEQIFKVGNWVKAVVIDVDRQRTRVVVSTRHIEKNPGDMLKDPYLVYATADEMAEQYRRNLDEKTSE